MFADTHCHLNFDLLLDDFEVILQGMTSQNVGMLVVPSVDRSSWGQNIDICAKDERLLYALGLHPLFVNRHSFDDLKELNLSIEKDKLNGDSALVAIGEIGLDYFAAEHEKQLLLFEAQLSLAEKYCLPVIVHSRKAHSEIFNIIKKFNLVGGVIHAFSGSYELMMRYIDLGFMLGVGPVITWPSASKTRSAISKAPIERLLLETDSPDMAVYGRLKGEGSPLDVVKVFDALVSIRGESKESLKNAVWINGKNLFK